MGLRGRETTQNHGGPTDRELVSRAQKGDPTAVGELYERYRGKVLNYLYRFTGERGRAEELTQDTFVRVVEHIGDYRPTGSVGGWIYRIAGNLALNAYRGRAGVREISLDEPLQLEVEGGEVSRAEVVAGSEPMPDEEAGRRERQEAVQKGLIKVGPHHRAVVILCDIEGHSYQETAEILNCPLNTVASRLARGRTELARVLGYLKKEGV